MTMDSKALSLTSPPISVYLCLCRRPDDLDFSEFMSKEEQRASLEKERQRQEEEERRIALEQKLAEEVEAEKLQLLKEKAILFFCLCNSLKLCNTFQCFSI